MAAVVLRKVPDSQLNDFPTVLIGAHVQLPDRPHGAAWIFEVELFYYGGSKHFAIWTITAPRHREQLAVKRLRDRAESCGVKVIWLYRFWRPPSDEMIDFINKFNRERDEFYGIDSIDSNRPQRQKAVG